MKMYKLFIVLMFGLFLVISCGKPTDPESLNPGGDGGYKIVSQFPTAGYAQDVIKKDSLVYIAQGEGGLMIINVADPKNPQSVSIITDVVGYPSKIAMKDNLIYLTSSSGITGINVIDPYKPEIVLTSQQNFKYANNLHIMRNYLFIALSKQGVNISEISNPTLPEVRGGVVPRGYSQGVTTTADSAFLLVACGEMGLSIFDISNFQDGYGIYPLVGWCDTPGYANDVYIQDDESLAYLACGTAGLQIIDFSDTSNIHLVGSYDGSGYAKELMYKNQRVYLAAQKGGLQIIDVADASNPDLFGIVEMEYAQGLDIDGKYIYVADEEDGLFTISIPE